MHEGEFTSVKQEEMFGAAKWVGCDGVTRAPVLRASFRADAARRAEVTICGLGYFTMYLNGRRVSDDLFVPATSDYVRRPITIEDAAGKIIKTLAAATSTRPEGLTPEGSLFYWNGTTRTGEKTPAGEYTIHVIAILGGESYNVQKTVTVE